MLGMWVIVGGGGGRGYLGPKRVPTANQIGQFDI